MNQAGVVAEHNVLPLLIVAAKVGFTVYTAYELAETANKIYDFVADLANGKEFTNDELLVIAAELGIEVVSVTVLSKAKILDEIAEQAAIILQKAGLDDKAAEIYNKIKASGGTTSVVVDGKTCVYSCVVDGQTRYVGITDDVQRRGREHMKSKGIEIEQIDGLDNLSRDDARAVEQALIHRYGLGKDGGSLSYNKINSISPTKRTEYENAIVKGNELLDSVDYQWTD